MSWIDKDTEIYCSFAKNAGNVGCQMMNSAFYYYGLNKIYKSFSVDNIKDAVAAAKILNFKGFAITMPYKKQILDYVDEADQQTKKIGAANTVLNDNGKLIAHNTDYLSAKNYLKNHLLKEKSYSRFYILGSGGYASAVKQASKELGIDHINITRHNWDDIAEIRGSLIFNCTPVEDIRNKISHTNDFIDCIVNTATGKRLASIQASYQFELYTGMKFPYGIG